MCGRYTLYQTRDLKKRFRLADRPTQDVDNNYNVGPGQFMPVIVRSEYGNQEELMKWGFVPPWAKDTKIGYRLINTRAESVFSSPMWRIAILRHRCLVPSRGFYEWKVLADGKKHPYYICPKDMELFAFAGIWSTWRDVEGRELKTFSILTTEPNKEMADIHNRMPVILKPDDEDRWLEPSLERAGIEALLHPYEDGGLEFFEVSRDVNVTRNNDNHLIFPVNSQ